MSNYNHNQYYPNNSGSVNSDKNKNLLKEDDPYEKNFPGDLNNIINLFLEDDELQEIEAQSSVNAIDSQNQFYDQANQLRSQKGDRAALLRATGDFEQLHKEGLEND